MLAYITVNASMSGRSRSETWHMRLTVGNLSGLKLNDNHPYGIILRKVFGNHRFAFLPQSFIDK